MNNDNQSFEVKTKIITSKWNWIFGIFFILAGIGGFEISIFYSAMFLISGLYLLPPVSRMIKERYNFQLSRVQKIIMVMLVLVISFFITINNTDTGNKNSNNTITPTTKNEESKPVVTEIVKIGDNAFLRLPNISDSKQIICLGTTKDDYSKIGKALLANDTMGLLEIPGAFCVGNGTKVLVIDSDFAIRRVRIIEGINQIDKDKAGLSGWVAKEFVSKN